MTTPTAPLNFFRAFTVALLLVFIGSACTNPLRNSYTTPVIQTIQVTQLATILVTQEVTRVVEIPVTVTPADTPSFTFTPHSTPPSPAPLRQHQNRLKLRSWSTLIACMARD